MTSDMESLLRMLCERTGARPAVIYPDRRQLAAQLGLSLETATVAIAHLETEGYLVIGRHNPDDPTIWLSKKGALACP